MQQRSKDRYRIVCGVDFSTASEAAIRESHRLSCRTAPSEVHFVHALGRRAESRHGDDGEGGIEHAVGRLEAFVIRTLSDLVDVFAATPVVFHARVESTESALAAVAREEDADVIVVGASLRSALSQLWSRSTVLRLMHTSPTPVLVAREREATQPGLDLPRYDSDQSGLRTVPSFVPTGPANAAWCDADSASNLCRVYEARDSAPDLVARLKLAPSATQRPRARAS